MKIRLTEAAKRDIIHVYLEGLEQFGVRQADAYHDRLEATFRIIGDNPEIARERTEITPPVRVHPCGAHMIVYELDQPGVVILRVRHHREDWKSSPIA